MKLLVCGACGDMNTLAYDIKRCNCGKTGGYYNSDGDTVTVWGVLAPGATPQGREPGVLLGLNNRAIHRAVFGKRVEDIDGFASLWPYPLDNGKVTVLTEALA